MIIFTQTHDIIETFITQRALGFCTKSASHQAMYHLENRGIG